MITVGLTGGIGSGKTAAAKIFERCGAVVIYADQVARAIVDNDRRIQTQIISSFGAESYLPDGRLNRILMADRIFNNLKLQRELNAVVHPVVIAEIDRTIKRLRTEKKYNIAIVEAALIFEAGIQNKFDYLVVVDADEDIRMRRMVLRNKKPESDIGARMKAQLSNRLKARQADFVIKNNGTMNDLEKATCFVYRLLVQTLGKAVQR